MTTGDGSERKEEDWRAGARLYSGRVDPSWIVPASRARALLDLWASLPPSDRVHPRSGGVGYRGCWLASPGGASWMASDGLVAERSPTSSEVRSDADRSFERAVLATAPKQVLPEGLLVKLRR